MTDYPFHSARVAELESKLATVTEQLTAAREELAESKQQINIRRSNNLRLDRITREQQELIENLKKLSGARESDCIAMREMATKIQAVTEQRDRLAEALGAIARDEDIPMSLRSCSPAYRAKQALQSLNQNAEVVAPPPQDSDSK